MISPLAMSFVAFANSSNIEGTPSFTIKIKALEYINHPSKHCGISPTWLTDLVHVSDLIHPPHRHESM